MIPLSQLERTAPARSIPPLPRSQTLSRPTGNPNPYQQQPPIKHSSSNPKHYPQIADPKLVKQVSQRIPNLPHPQRLSTLNPYNLDSRAEQSTHDSGLQTTLSSPQSSQVRLEQESQTPEHTCKARPKQFRVLAKLLRCFVVL